MDQDRRPTAALLDLVGWDEVVARAALPVSVVDTRGRQVAGNAAYAEFLGYSLDELEHLDVNQLTRDTDRTWTATYLQRLAAGELDRFTTTKTFVRRDGSQVTGVLDAQPIHRDGECVGFVATITPAQRPAPLADESLRRLVENVTDTIILCDENGFVLDTTGRYTDVLGYPPEYWEGRSLFELLIDEDPERIRTIREWVLANPGSSFNTEVQVRTAANQVQTIEVNVVNLLEDPAVRGVLLTTRNVTEVRRLIDQLSASRDEALAEAELRSRLIATVAHELRNPLHAMQGISEMIASGRDGADTRRLAGVLNRQVRDLARIVDDLLTSSRIEAGTLTLEPALFDLRALLRDLVSVYGTDTDGGTAIRVLVEDSVPPVVGSDPVRLRQVLSNLIGNGVKFADGGRVHVLAWIEDERLLIDVRDSGPGIPGDELREVFLPFVTGSNSGAGAGAGLGLSIVRRIVEAMDGEITVDSTVGTGTTFRVSLPLIEVDGPAPVLDTEPAIDDSPRHLHVLVVEDNLVNQQLALAQLEVLGHAAVIAGSGEEALEILQTGGHPPFDVVLMDYHLPGIDGIETTRHVRRLEQHLGRRHHIVGVTASAALGDRASSLAADMDDHVAKPVRLADLQQVLAAVQPAEPPPSRPPRAADHGVVDTVTLDELVAEFDDRSVVEGLVATYLEELPGRIDGIIEAAATQDGERIGLLVHTLTSSSRLVGAGPLAAEASAFATGRIDIEELRWTARATERELRDWIRS